MQINLLLYGRPLYEVLEGLSKGVRDAARRITPEGVDVILGLGQGHPHRTKQFAFHAFRLTGKSQFDSPVGSTYLYLPSPFTHMIFPSLRVVPWEEKHAKREVLWSAHVCFGSRVDAPSPGSPYEIGW